MGGPFQDSFIDGARMMVGVVWQEDEVAGQVTERLNFFEGIHCQ